MRLWQSIPQDEYLAKDQKQAPSWYKRSAELDHLPALVKIGLFHENGYGGLERSDEAALVCYLRCADKGNTQAQYLAARIYEKKMLSETMQHKQDEYRRSAKRLYEAAALKEYRDARSRLRSL